MTQNFSRSKILQEPSKAEHFQWGLKFWGYKFGGKVLDLSKVQVSNNYHMCNILDWEVKNHQITLKQVWLYRLIFLQFYWDIFRVLLEI